MPALLPSYRMSSLSEVLPRIPPPERRGHSRQRVPFAYLDLGEQSAGAILDISEGGVAIQGALRFSQNTVSTLRFRFSESEPWIEAHGRLAWASNQKKSAGIEFADLEDAARQRIRDWSQKMATATASPLRTNEPLPFPSPRAATAAAVLPLNIPAPKLTAPEPPAFRSESWRRQDFEPGHSGVLVKIIAAVLILVALFFIGRLIGRYSLLHDEKQPTPPVSNSLGGDAIPVPQPAHETRVPSRASDGASPTSHAAARAKANAAPAASPRKLASAAPAPAPTAFIVQVAAMKVKQNGDALVARLGAQNVSAFLIQREDGHLYLVSVGPFADAASAATAKQQLEAQGYQTIVRAWPLR